MALETTPSVRRAASLASLALAGALTACAGGSSSSPQCLLDADCTVPTGVTCRVPACDRGTCSIGPAPAGTTCAGGRCDAAGGCVACLTPADCGAPALCTVRTCSGGACGTASSPQGTACGSNLACDGAGHCVAPCASASDCPGADGACRTRTCVAGQCGVDDAPAGTVVPSPVGDCHALQCDGAGNATVVVDDLDVPVDGNACTLDLCTAGTPSNPYAPAGTACVGGVCDGAGACLTSVNGCAPAAFVDLTAQATATVTFPGTGLSFAYTPACLRVRAGTAVTFSGDFLSHPLQGGTVVGAVATPATTGPFAAAVTAGTSHVFTMADVGDFPYYCEVHFASGMAGVVSVVP